MTAAMTALVKRSIVFGMMMAAVAAHVQGGFPPDVPGHQKSLTG